MSRAEKYLPYVLSALIPFIQYFSSDVELSRAAYSKMAFSYCISVTIILLFWFVNSYLNNRLAKERSRSNHLWITILVNGIIIGTISSAHHFYLSSVTVAAVPTPILTIRLSILTLIFNIILRVFSAQRESARLKMLNLQLQSENLKFQLDTLKQQVNPHFLFNSFNTLLDLIEEDQKAAAKYTRSFASLYRAVLQSSKHDFVDLREELAFLDDYWRLLKVRFQEAIELDVKIEPEKFDSLIPPLSLQLLIENAVKHNEASTSHPLLITIVNKEDSLIVENQVRPFKNTHHDEKIGLQNLQQRFTALSKPITYGVIDGKFKVILPLKRN